MEKNKIKNDCPIGFFDSGVGGLSVYSRFRKLLPNENLMYFADLKNMPYGDKTKDELISFARNILDFYKEKQVKAVVIACNTSSALAYETIKPEYDFNIYPIIQSCAKLLAKENIERLGVFATEGTVKSSAYKNEILKYNPTVEVKEIACPSWVNYVENNVDLSIVKEDIRSKISEMKEFLPQKIVLGCTHYPYLLDILKLYEDKDIFIDPAEIFVKYIRSDLNELGLLNNSGGSEEFFVSEKPNEFVKNAKLFYTINDLPSVINFLK